MSFGYALAACAVLFVTFFVPPLAGFSQEGDHVPQVENLRIGKDTIGSGKDTRSRTRIVLDMDRPVDYNWFTLPKPARLVVDFPAVGFKTQPAAVTIPPGSQVVGMRAGQFRPGIVRMVMDMAEASRVGVFTIPGNTQRGPRVVIDVLPLRPGETPTDVPPPTEVVTNDAAPTEQVIVRKPSDEQSAPQRVVKSDKNAPVVVVLDPGHGGVDPGGCGRNKVCEKNIVLEMARLIREQIESRDVKVVLTRDKDIFIPLPERGRIAQRAGADLFVSLHADIHPTNRTVKGATVYMVSEKASDREAARLAASENEGDVLAGVALAGESKEVQSILISLMQRDTINNSAYLGQSILKNMDKATYVRDNNLLFAGFRVLKTPDVPSVLVEMGYLSNPDEERQLNSPAYRKKLAGAIADGIKAYIKANVHKN